jgi:hypothetical protein
VKVVAVTSLVASLLGSILGATEALPPWAQYGIVGLVGGMLIVTKQLVPGWVYQEVRTERDELKADNKVLVHQLIEAQTTTIPVLQASTRAVEDAMALIRRTQ